MFAHFSSCYAETLNKVGKDKLKKSVDKIGDWSQWSHRSTNFWDNLMRLIGRGIVNAVISIGVKPDPYHPNTQVLTVCILFLTRQMAANPSD